MKLRDMANLVVKPLLGSELRKIQRGSDLWRDIYGFSGKEETRTIFDIGANVGQSAQEFLELFPSAEIYSFEPGPETFRQLSKSVEGKSRVHSFNQALGAVRGRFEFQENTFSGANSFLDLDSNLDLYLSRERLSSITKSMVEVNTLDHFCGEKGIEQIDLAKLDVQGFELNVLQGASELLRKKAIGVVMLEVMFVPLYANQATFSQIQEYMAKFGYHISCFYNFAYTGEHRLMWCEALFIPTS